jgi:hypothetical protein
MARSAAFLRYSVFLVHYSIFLFGSGLSGLGSGNLFLEFSRKEIFHFSVGKNGNHSQNSEEKREIFHVFPVNN